MRSFNHCCCEKAMSITYYECVLVALGIQHAMRIPNFYLCLLRLYRIFPHYLINAMIFRKKFLNIKCVFWFVLKLLAETFLLLKRVQLDVIIKLRRSSCKVPVILVRFQCNLDFLRRFWKNTQRSNFIKVLPLGTESSADKRTEMTKLICIVIYSFFGNSPASEF